MAEWIAGWQAHEQSAASNASPETYTRDFLLSIGPYSDDETVLVSFRGSAGANVLYAFDVLFFVKTSIAASHTISTDASDGLIGERARLFIPGNPEPRSVHGIVSQLTLLAVTDDRLVFQARISPGLWRLNQSYDTRVFQNMTASEIVSEVLDTHHLKHSFRLAASLNKREYCLQYDESDYAFVARLLAEEGIAYWFEHDAYAGPGPVRGSGTSETIVMLDSDALYVPIPGNDQLTFRPEGDALASSSDDVQSFHAMRRVTTDAVSLRRYDFERAVPLAGAAIATPQPQDSPAFQGGVGSASASKEEIGGATLEEYEPHLHDHESSPTAERVVRRLEQWQVPSLVGQGTSLCRRLSPGLTFEIENAEHAVVGSRLVATIVHHSGTNMGGVAPRYQNRFECVSSEVVCRPPPLRKPVLQVAETGVVVGPEGEEIATDAHGRVRVQFHWDRRAENNERSSCWMRVMQPWSGPTYGFQFTPRIGTEVLVTFIAGDPDRPVVIGCLPNATNTLPYALPDNATRSAIRSCSSPSESGGYNEISFEDRTGSELLKLRAERNFDHQALKDHFVRVGANQETTVGCNRKVSVTDDDELLVSKNRSVTIDGNLTQKIGATQTTNVSENHHLSIGAESSLKTGGNRDITIGGDLSFVVGAAQAGTATVQANDELTLVGTNRVRINSPTVIELSCGTSLVTIEPDRVSVLADSIELKGRDEVALRKDSTELIVADSIDAGSDNITLQASQGKLELSDDAILYGANVSLTGPAAASRTAPGEEEPAKGEARFQIDPPSGFEGVMTVVVAMPNGEVTELETDSNNEIVIEGVEGDSYKILEIRAGEQRLPYVPMD